MQKCTTFNDDNGGNIIEIVYLAGGGDLGSDFREAVIAHVRVRTNLKLGVQNCAKFKDNNGEKEIKTV